MTYPAMPLGDLVIPRPGTRTPATGGEATFKYVDLESVDREKKVISSPKVTICKNAPSRARKVIKADDVLVSLVRPNLNAVAMVPPELDNEIASTGFCVLRATERVLPLYVYFAVRSPTFINGLCGLVSGALYPAVTESQVLSQRIPVPPVEEQRRIVDRLSRAENIVRMRREAEQKAKEIIPALFLDMFGDPATNPKGWAQSSLGEVIEQFRYGSSQKSSANGDPVLRIPNVVGGNIDVGNLKFIDASDSDRTRYALARGDILFVRTNGNPDYVGRCAVFEPPTDQRWLYASYLIRGRPVPDAIDPQFLQVQLSSVEGRRRLRERARTAAGQYNINVEGLRSVPIVLPPIDLQCAFSGLVRRAKELAAGSASASAIATASFQSLLSGVFSERRAT